MKTSIITVIVTLILLSSMVFAQDNAPMPTPHQFYGSVLIDGVNAPDNTKVIAKIDGSEVAATFTNDGSYGLSPNIFYVEDPNGNRAGKLVEFYVNGNKGGQHVFTNGGSSKVNLDVAGTCGDNLCSGSETSSSCSADCGSPSSGGSSSGGGGGGSSGGGFVATSSTTTDNESNTTTTTQEDTTTECVSNWDCSEWLDCVNGVQKQVCTDLNQCGNSSADNRMIKKQECGNLEAGPADPTSNTQPSEAGFGITGAVTGLTGSTTGIVALIVVVALIAGALLYVFVFSKRKRSKK